MARILKGSKNKIWDEWPMAHMRIGINEPKCFGGAIILLPCDFRQTLPVIPRSTAADEINACLKSSNL